MVRDILIFCCFFEIAMLYRINLPYTDDPIYYYHEAPATTQKPKFIPLCDYWRILGVEREECMEESEQDLVLEEVAVPLRDDFQPDKRIQSFEIGLPVCRVKFLSSSCVKSDKCASGTVCLDYQTTRCCHPPPGTCPTPAQLGYRCKVFTPISWCSTDRDCKGKKCCPTGCNYNVCV